MRCPRSPEPPRPTAASARRTASRASGWLRQACASRSFSRSCGRNRQCVTMRDHKCVISATLYDTASSSQAQHRVPLAAHARHAQDAHPSAAAAAAGEGFTRRSVGVAGCGRVCCSSEASVRIFVNTPYQNAMCHDGRTNEYARTRAALISRGFTLWLRSHVSLRIAASRSHTAKLFNVNRKHNRTGAPYLGRADFPWLHVVVSVPCELAHRRQPQPHRQGGQACQSSLRRAQGSVNQFLSTWYGGTRD